MKKIIILVFTFTSLFITAFSFNAVYAVENKIELKVVEMEVLGEWFVSPEIYERFDLYANFDEVLNTELVTNLYSVTLNNNILYDLDFLFFDGVYNLYVMYTNEIYFEDLENNGDFFNTGSMLSVGDVLIFTFEVEVIPPPPAPLLSNVLKMFTDLIILPLDYTLLAFGVDISTVMVGIGFYTAWFTLSVYDIIVIFINILLMIYILKITLNILKGIYRRLRG